MSRPCNSDDPNWGLTTLPGSPVTITYHDVPEAPGAIRERAYTLARQELPDAPVEDVICRAERIAAYLARNEPAPKP